MHRIIVVGGGAGGLELMTKLADTFHKSKEVSLLLVDKNLTHVWKPLLHEVASSTLNINDNEVNYIMHSYEHGYNFTQGSLADIDKNKKNIHVEITSTIDPNIKKIEELSYDTLILSLGSRSNDFNTPGVKENCYFLDTKSEAESIYKYIFSTYLDIRNKFIDLSQTYNVAIVGGGATGVELITELVHLKETLAKSYFKETQQLSIQFILIDASDRILSALSEDISNEAEKVLSQMGVQILKNHRVSKVDKENIYFPDGSKISADLKIWTAGIKATEAIEQLDGFEKDNIGRLKVYATLQTYTDPNIFALGDCAHCQLDAKKPPLGARAQVASQQAEFLAQALEQRLIGKPLPLFKFSDKGSIISLSQDHAVGEVFSNLNIYGTFARKAYEALYRIHQINIHGVKNTYRMSQKDSITKNLLKKVF
ncbi:NAD(P)/FAD-dependent oxidoreductase [Acinetobacter suaedae]|uniref:NAD(P)/FAD-dependent oxidoreductase n=1 Tax=Acinetobacter suaedae TaxID=2609668 RepID=A0A5P1UVR7_9GAMM|nr:NAD(P)/FAD-dependent oxidoreductase [Acinetobacter sp. C16S1]QER40223.1 NAD(P)/FAD-dependent oxidoreductase [Acinetobacter sp. C16S1]